MEHDDVGTRKDFDMEVLDHITFFISTADFLALLVHDHAVRVLYLSPISKLLWRLTPGCWRCGLATSPTPLHRRRTTIPPSVSCEHSPIVPIHKELA